MASTKTRTKTIRIANEACDYFEDKPLNRLVESVYSLLKEGEMIFDGENVILPKKESSSGVYTDELSDIEEMVTLLGGTLGVFLRDIRTSLDDGRLSIENGRVKCVLPEWVERFEDICHDKGVPTEKMVEIVRKM